MGLCFGKQAQVVPQETSPKVSEVDSAEKKPSREAKSLFNVPEVSVEDGLVGVVSDDKKSKVESSSGEERKLELSVERNLGRTPGDDDALWSEASLVPTGRFLGQGVFFFYLFFDPPPFEKMLAPFIDISQTRVGWGDSVFLTDHP